MYIWCVASELMPFLQEGPVPKIDQDSLNQLV